MQCYLNGEFLPLAQARISPLDRGFLFGDGVYEVVPVYRRQPFYWRRHMRRLAASLEKIHLPFDIAALDAPMRRLIAEEEAPEQALYLQITRGEMPARLLPITAPRAPTVFMMTSPRAPQSAAAAAALAEGISCSMAEDIRWSRCDIKSTSLLGAALLAPRPEEAEEEVVILRGGVLSEGSRGNFIVVKDGVLHTPLADQRMLHGITYQVVREVAQGCGIPCREGDIPAALLAAADELWLTSSIREMLPVVRVGGAAVGDGTPGAVFRRVHAAWQAHVDGGAWADGADE